MKKSIVLVSAILALGSCSTSPVATCSPGDTACLEAALAASAAPATEASAPGETNRDGGSGRLNIDVRPDSNPPALGDYM